jgi:hypothetical protein
MIELGIFLKFSNVTTVTTLKLDSAILFTIATIAFEVLFK